jgi:hypothetical protein
MDADKAGVEFALLNPLLRALEMLMFISRHLHPPDFESLMAEPSVAGRQSRSKGTGQGRPVRGACLGLDP